jgi:FKBP-type peptidyl-prolyl cis-trans isomerase
MSNECHKLKKKAQQKWTIKHTGGNVKDWWDRVSLVRDTLKSGDNYTYPRKGDFVQIDYVGKLLNGKSFGWSRKPLRFRIGDPGVIDGLNKGVKQMSLGEKAKLYIPAEMAYGWTGGSDNLVPPDSDIIMTVTLLQVQRKDLMKRPKTGI